MAQCDMMQYRQFVIWRLPRSELDTGRLGSFPRVFVAPMVIMAAPHGELIGPGCPFKKSGVMIYPHPGHVMKFLS